MSCESTMDRCSDDAQCCLSETPDGTSYFRESCDMVRSDVATALPVPFASVFFCLGRWAHSR